MIRSSERPSLIMVCDITVAVGEFPSFERSFFDADTLRNTARACVAELRIGFLPPVHSPFGACTQLPTINMDPHAHLTPLIEVRGFATVFVLSNLNTDHQAWW